MKQNYFPASGVESKDSVPRLHTNNLCSEKYLLKNTDLRAETLREWRETGKIRFCRNKNKKFLYPLEDLLRILSETPYVPDPPKGKDPSNAA